MSIVVTDISKVYGTQKALDAVSFQLQKGEIVGFLGPNGAGKSTMMKVLTTYLQPTTGIATVQGFDIHTQSRAVQQSVGYLPEHNPLYLELYVREYLKFNASIYKVAHSRIEEVIQLTGLGDESHKKIGQLSKGYRQRVGLANALLHDPEVLILDEPTTGLDPNQLVEIRNLIKTIGATKTILMSTHIMQEVEAICDRVLIINKGKIVADRSLSALREGQQQLIAVEFDFRVETVALERLPKIASVKNPQDFMYELSFDTDTDMRATVFDFAQDNGLKILQLNQKNASLEELFRTLTQS